MLCIKLSLGATVHKGDVCNLQMLEHLFETHTFSHVVHMVSKEGTEGSMKDPLEFVEANTECLLVLLKALVGYKVREREKERERNEIVFKLNTQL